MWEFFNTQLSLEWFMKNPMEVGMLIGGVGAAAIKLWDFLNRPFEK